MFMKDGLNIILLQDKIVVCRADIAAICSV